jgi:Tfp pilus assembly protein PilP
MILACSPLLAQGTGTNPAQQEAPAAQPDAAPPGEPGAAPPAPPFGLPPPLTKVSATGEPQPFPNREKVLQALLQNDFSYQQNTIVDPFVSFIAPAEAPPPPPTTGDEDVDLPPEPQRPLTPLQKMSLAEVEKGLKAIVWGDLGRRALVEDSAGKGYIVNVGTPVGERNGVITEIFNDRVVIQQEFWDRQAKRMKPLNFVVKLKKEEPKK